MLKAFRYVCDNDGNVYYDGIVAAESIEEARLKVEKEFPQYKANDIHVSNLCDTLYGELDIDIPVIV